MTRALVLHGAVQRTAASFGGEEGGHLNSFPQLTLVPAH